MTTVGSVYRCGDDSNGLPEVQTCCD